MQSKAATVKEYMNGLPVDRRDALQAVRQVILKNLDKDYEEGMQYGMIGYYVPHRVFPAGYHCDPTKPLPFAALASQKHYMSLHLTFAYGEAAEKRFRAAWAESGKRLDMGKCCIRFKTLDDLPLDVIGDEIRRLPARAHVQLYEKAIGSRPPGKPAARRTATDKPLGRAPRPTRAGKPTRPVRAGRRRQAGAS